MSNGRNVDVRSGRLSVLVCCVLAVGLGQRGNVPNLGYAEVPEWPVQATSAAGTPAAWNFGQVTAVATDARGYILVLHRGADPIMAFNNGGQFVRSWGDGMISEGKVVALAPGDRVAGESGYTAVYGPAGCYSCGAHSVRVDPEGHVWVVDAGGHVVYKMDQEGRLIMQLGTRGVSGASVNTFDLPTDVAFAHNGDIYVSDGYGNARVVKYSRDGRYLLHWGTRGTGPGEFDLPHNLVVDAQGRVYVTDRDNQRIQVFDSDGRFLDQWADTGGISSLLMTKDQHIWAGGVLRSLKGEILGRLPGAGGGHGTTVTEAGEVFLAQMNEGVQKFVPLRP